MSLESCLCHSWAVYLDLVRVAAGTHIHLQGTGASAGSQPAQRTGRGFLIHCRRARRVVPPPLEIIWWPLKHKQISLVAQTVKCLPTMLETRDRSLGWEDPLEKEMATHSSIIAWKIPWTEDPGGPHSMGSQRVEHD